MKIIIITTIFLLNICLITGNVIMLESLSNSEPTEKDWVQVQKTSTKANNFKFSKYFDEIESKWSAFIADFNKVYSDIKEEEKRFLIFAENFLRIKQHNIEFFMGKKTFTMGVNQFSDMTKDELKVYRGYRQSLPGIKGSMFMSSAVPITAPTSIDWRTKGAVTPVKNQGQCGSCWAFSTTGSLEGQHFRNSGHLVSLSEQQLVDCSKKNNGCNGGLMDLAFNYIKKNHGIDTEEAYPYVSGNTSHAAKKCSFLKDKVGAMVTGLVDIPQGDETKLMEAVARVGPVSVAIDASHSSFQQYESGVYDEPECSTENLDHGVLVVGYGVEEGTPYWLVKNSWAAIWGEKGYIKMRRNNENMCGIASKASYPLV